MGGRHIPSWLRDRPSSVGVARSIGRKPAGSRA